MYISPSHLKFKYTYIMSKRTGFEVDVDTSPNIDLTNPDSNGFERGVTPAKGSSRTVGASRPANGSYDPDQWYLNEIEKYVSDPEFYEYLMSNPHLIRNSGVYQPYWYETAIGTRDTNEARYNAQMKSEASSWLADALSSRHQENYTSPAAQAARMTEAGINVNLNGGQGISSGDPASPSPEDTDTNLPYASTDAGTAQTWQFCQTTISAVMSLVSNGLTWAQQFQSLQSGEIALLNSDIESEMKLTDLVPILLGRSMTDQEVHDFVNGKDMADSVLSLNPDLSHLPRRLRKRLLNVLYNYDTNSLISKGSLEDILGSYHSSRSNLANILGHPFYKEDFNETVRLISEYVSKYQIEYDKLWKDFDFDKLSVVDKETGMTLGEMEGQAQLASKRYEALRAQSDGITEKLWNDIEKHLKSKNTWWSNLLLFFIPFARSMANNARMPSIGLSASVRNGVHDTKDVYMH